MSEKEIIEETVRLSLHKRNETCVYKIQGSFLYNL